MKPFIVNGKEVSEAYFNFRSQSLGLGDKIAVIANPIAKALKLPCVDKKTGKLRLGSGCGKMKARLNAGMSVAEAMKLRVKGK